MLARDKALLCSCSSFLFLKGLCAFFTGLFLFFFVCAAVLCGNQQDPAGTFADAEANPVVQAVKILKQAFPELVVAKV